MHTPVFLCFPFSRLVSANSIKKRLSPFFVNGPCITKLEIVLSFLFQIQEAKQEEIMRNALKELPNLFIDQ